MLNLKPEKTLWHLYSLQEVKLVNGFLEEWQEFLSVTTGSVFISLSYGNHTVFISIIHCKYWSGLSLSLPSLVMSSRAVSVLVLVGFVHCTLQLSSNFSRASMAISIRAMPFILCKKKKKKRCLYHMMLYSGWNHSAVYIQYLSLYQACLSVVFTLWYTLRAE